MELKDLLRNSVVATFTRNQKLLGVLAEYFSDIRGVAIIDLLSMEADFAEKFISAFKIDIAFIDDAYVDNAAVHKIIQEESAEGYSGTTHFVFSYNDSSAEKMLDFGESLLRKKLPVTPFRLDDEEDYIIFAQTIYGILRPRLERYQI